MARPIPEYKLDRKLSEFEKLDRHAAWIALNKFAYTEGVNDFAVEEVAFDEKGSFLATCISGPEDRIGQNFTTFYPYAQESK